MSEFAASCHSLSHACANVVVLDPVGGIDCAKVGKLKDVFECIILAVHSGAINLLLFDLLLLHCLVCEPTFEALLLVFCRVVTPMSFRCVHCHKVTKTHVYLYAENNKSLFVRLQQKI